MYSRHLHRAAATEITPSDETAMIDASERSVQHEIKISVSALSHVLRGVEVAMKASRQYVEPIELWLSSQSASGAGNARRSLNDAVINACSISEWRSGLSFGLQTSPEDTKQLASITLAVAFLREKSRLEQHVSSTEISTAWDLIHTALTSDKLAFPLGIPSRSAQGFLAVPLCSLNTEGCIDELFSTSCLDS